MALTIASLLLPGCGTGDDPGSVFEDYRRAVADGFDVDLATLPAYPAFDLNYPDRQQRQAPVAAVNVSLRNFWTFSHCNLRAAIAERNSPIGRAPSAVVQLPYEHELLVALRQCAESLDREEATAEFLEVLNTVSAQKLDNGDAAFWNGTFGSAEFASLFSTSVSRLSLDGADTYLPLEELRYFLLAHDSFGQPDSVLTRERLAESYQGLELSRFGGRLIKSLDEANFYLGEINRLFSEHSDPERLCPMRAPTRRVRELDGALRRYHIRILQPYLAEIGRRGRPWLESVTALAEKQSSIMPAGFQPFYRQYLNTQRPEGIWQTHVELLRRHATNWSALLDHCGIALR